MSFLRALRLFACLLLGAGALARAEAPTGLVFQEASHDFGRIASGRKVTHVFKGVNGGQVPLRITQVQPGCGCTSAVLGQSTVAPGGSVEIQVTFDPGAFSGPVNKSVVLHTDDPGRPLQTLGFRADVFRPLELMTKALIFDDVPRTAGGRGEVRVRSNTGRPAAIARLAVPAKPYLEAAVRMDGAEAVVEVTLRGDRLPAEVWRGADDIQIIPADPEAGPLTLTLYWTVQGAPTRSRSSHP